MYTYTNEIKEVKAKMDKKGKLTTASLNTAILAIVLLVVLFRLYAGLVPEAQSAGNELNATGVPLGTLFTGNGVVFIIIMAALIVVVVKSFMAGGK